MHLGQCPQRSVLKFFGFVGPPLWRNFLVHVLGCLFSRAFAVHCAHRALFFSNSGRTAIGRFPSDAAEALASRSGAVVGSGKGRGRGSKKVSFFFQAQMAGISGRTQAERAASATGIRACSADLGTVVGCRVGMGVGSDTCIFAAIEGASVPLFVPAGERFCVFSSVGGTRLNLELVIETWHRLLRYKMGAGAVRRLGNIVLSRRAARGGRRHEDRVSFRVANPDEMRCLAAGAAPSAAPDATADTLFSD